MICEADGPLLPLLLLLSLVLGFDSAFPCPQVPSSGRPPSVRRWTL